MNRRDFLAAAALAPLVARGCAPTPSPA